MTKSKGLKLIVATEICQKTGSWLSDYVVDEKIRAYFLDRKSHSGKSYLSLKKSDKLCKEIYDSFQLKSKKIIIRETSLFQDKLSYRIHTNRELSLMISGRKDFAVFAKKIGENFDVFNGQKFGKYRNIIFSKKYLYKDNIYYFKYLSKSNWKLESYILLIKTRDLYGNSQHLEFIEGNILGYSDQENIEFIRSLFKI